LSDALHSSVRDTVALHTGSPSCVPSLLVDMNDCSNLGGRPRRAKMAGHLPALPSSSSFVVLLYTPWCLSVLASLLPICSLLWWSLP
jgi:hypothetical protein